MRNTKKRSGAILAAALVCLLIVMLLSAALARSMIARDRATRWDARQVQCMWLAESAALRAVARYRQDPSYSGESWQIMVPSGNRPLNARAEIVVQPLADDDPRRIARITAYWPDDPMDRVTRKTELILPPPAPGESP